MAETKSPAAGKVIEYGGRKIPIPDDMTQEQAKDQMARFFPELADPKIESKKDGDKTVWVFSKKAGTKGAPTHADLVKRLAGLKTTPLAPAWLVDAALGRPGKLGSFDKAAKALLAEARQVNALKHSLDRLAPAWPEKNSGGVLL